MIFYRPFSIERVVENNELTQSSTLEIESGNFFIGQIMDITDWNETLAACLRPKNSDQISNFTNNNWQVLGQVVEIYQKTTKILVLGSLQAKSLEELVVKPASFTADFSVFSPSVLGRFWGNPNFLETGWQNEEIQGQLLGSKLLAGKKVDYNQKALHWQRIPGQNLSTTSFITIMQNSSQEKVEILPQESNPISLKIGQTNHVSRPLTQNFSQVCLNLISQIKNQLIQPLFIIVSKTSDSNELKNFYFNLAESENLFNCLVIASPRQEQNKLWQTQARQIGQFLQDVLNKPVFLILDWPVSTLETVDSPVGLTEIQLI